jgi:DNA transformation protein
MAVNPEYKAYVLDQLSPLGPVMARAMFGGAGIYLDGFMFALITQADVLYFRTSDANRDEYKNADMGPFVTNKEKGTVMPYHELPLDIIEDGDDMCDWARRAWDVAATEKAAKKK